MITDIYTYIHLYACVYIYPLVPKLWGLVTDTPIILSYDEEKNSIGNPYLGVL